MRFVLARILLALAALSIVQSAGAQGYPTRPIRFIVGQGAGGASDVVARAIAQKLAERLGQQVIVDNRAGANGIIAMEATAKAAPDGYTIALGSSPMLAINPSLYRQLPYEPVRDFSPIALVGVASYVIVARPSLPANSVKELVALAKSKPGHLNYGAGSSGARIGTEMFNSAAGISLTYIPYKSAPQALTDLLSGQVDLVLEPVMSASAHIKADRLKALAVSTAKRVPQFPDIPTLAELGIPGYEFSSWLSIHAPAGTPKSIVEKLNTEIVRILKLPEIVDQLRSIGFEPQPSTPEELAAFTVAEIAKYAKVVKTAGIPAE